MEKIYNTKALSLLLKLSRMRIVCLLKEGRMKPDFTDNAGRQYWGEKTIKHYIVVMQIPAKKGTPRQFD